MKWSDINFQANTWSISASVAKGKRRRVLPINSGALAILDELSNKGNSEYVFLNSNTGDRLKSVDKIWQRVRKSAGLEGSGIVIHSLRHHAASAMISAGTDLATVRDLMGHAQISTTERYLHASGKSLRSGSDSIEGYLEKALAKKAS
jgi:site-specific recombinase XerD